MESHGDEGEFRPRGDENADEQKGREGERKTGAAGQRENQAGAGQENADDRIEQAGLRLAVAQEARPADQRRRAGEARQGPPRRLPENQTPRRFQACKKRHGVSSMTVW